MKSRYGFVTNSSSSSFVILRKDSTALSEQILMRYSEVIELLPEDVTYMYGTNNPKWHHKIETDRFGDTRILFETDMNNFDLVNFARDLGLHPSDIRGG